MADEKTDWTELAKYPVAVISIFFGLVGAKHILGIPLDALSEVGKDGVKFTRDTKGEIASLNAELSATKKSIEEINKQLQSKPLSTEVKSEIFEASQTVSDRVAQLTTVNTSADKGKADSSGYIWIGDYNDKSTSWQRVKLVSPATNTPLTAAPSTLIPGTVFTVSGNMVIREGLPRNDKDYFQGQRSLGVLPSGSRIRILSIPVGIDREFAKQYWAQVSLQP